MPRKLVLAVLLVALLAATFFALFPVRQDEKGPLILAAASLREALGAAADAWQTKGHARPVLSFAGTPALARQIEAGASADLFISADEQWMDELATKNLIHRPSRTTFLGNRLVIVELASKDTRLNLQPGDELARALGAGRVAMADPEAVPAGRYASQAFTALGVWQEVEDRIIRTENVRVAQMLVSQGEVPLGIVYETDALADPKLRTVATFPASSHVPITYPLVRLKTSDHPDTQSFRRFLLSAEAAAIFRRFGFDTATEG